jgi:hypothetical protein
MYNQMVHVGRKEMTNVPDPESIGIGYFARINNLI